MKKLVSRLLLIIWLFAFFTFVPEARATCTGPNEWTGLCDNPGYPVSCPSSNACCQSSDECSLTPPQTGDFSCTWNGSSCVVGFSNCLCADVSTCQVSDPDFCAGFGAGDCNGKTSSCIFPTTFNGPAVFCVANNPDDRTNNPASGKIATAIGCIPIDNAMAISSFFLSWGVGIGGGIALILIVISGYMITTSGANPDKIQAGKELLTAAISGLVLIIMAAYIFRVIGLEILRIPGF